MRNGWNGVVIGLGLAGGLMCLPIAHAQPTPKPNSASSKSDEAALKAAKARMEERIRAKTAPPLPPAPPREMKPPRYDSLPPAPPPPPPPPRASRYAPSPSAELSNAMFQVSATPDGKAIYAIGYLGAGSFQKLKKVMDGNPKADTLVIASPGGLVIEGAMAAHYIRARQINVVAHNFCSSSCTMILAAGKESTAEEGTRIGFHKSYSPFASRYYPKETKGLEAISDVVFRQSYAKSAVDQGFVDKALRVSSTTLWHPDQDTLISVGILSRKSKEKGRYTLPANALTRASIAEKLLQISFWKDAYRANASVVDEAIDTAWMTATLAPTIGDAQTNALRHLTDRVLVSLPALPDASLGVVANALNAHFAQKVAEGQTYCGQYDVKMFGMFFGSTSEKLSPAQQALIIEMLKTPMQFTELSEDDALASIASLMVEVGAADGLSSTEVLTTGFSGGKCLAMSKIHAHIATLNEKDRARTLRSMVALPDAISKLTRQTTLPF